MTPTASTTATSYNGGSTLCVIRRRPREVEAEEAEAAGRARVKAMVMGKARATVRGRVNPKGNLHRRVKASPHRKAKDNLRHQGKVSPRDNLHRRAKASPRHKAKVSRKTNRRRKAKASPRDNPHRRARGSLQASPHPKGSLSNSRVNPSHRPVSKAVRRRRKIRAHPGR